MKYICIIACSRGFLHKHYVLEISTYVKLVSWLRHCCWPEALKWLVRRVLVVFGYVIPLKVSAYELIQLVEALGVTSYEYLPGKAIYCGKNVHITTFEVLLENVMRDKHLVCENLVSAKHAHFLAIALATYNPSSLMNLSSGLRCFFINTTSFFVKMCAKK